MDAELLKAHNKGYTKKDGTYVAPFDDKRDKAEPKPAPKIVAAKQKPSMYGDDSFGATPKHHVKGPSPASAPKQWWVTKPKYFDDGKYSGEGKTGSLFGGGGGGSAPKAEKPFTGVIHPKANDEGKPVKVYSPTKETGPETWTDPHAIADFTPGGAAPESLNGVAFAPWKSHPKTDEGWAYVEGQNDDLAEPKMVLPAGLSPAAGVVIEEPDGRVWVVRPSNAFAGYRATFPKGHADKGHSLQATAIKECFEESGLQVEITGFLQDVARTSTMTRYYTARRVGGTPTDMGWESQAVSLVPKVDLLDVLNQRVDHAVGKQVGGGGNYENMEDWEQVGKQAGSNPGGVFKDESGHKWYCKFPKKPEIAKNEVLGAKLYAAAGVRVPELKLVTDDGRVGVASRIVPGLTKDPDLLPHAEGALEGFAVDAWLANWDVVGTGHDNLLVDPEERAVRVDTGGALAYRAQGSEKGAAFGDTVGEIETMRSPKNPFAYSVFGKMTKDQIAESVNKVASVHPDTIRKLVAEFGPQGKNAKAALADKLIARRASLLKIYLTGK